MARTLVRHRRNSVFPAAATLRPLAAAVCLTLAAGVAAAAPQVGPAERAQAETGASARSRKARSGAAAKYSVSFDSVSA